MIVLAAGAFLAFGALLVLFGANASEIVVALGIDDEGLGLVGSMLSLGLGAGILAAGPVVDRIPRRPLFLTACAVVVVATTTIGAWTSFPALLIHTACIGFGAGFYETLLNTVIVERGGAQAARRLLFVHAAATLGAAATPLAIAALRDAAAISWFDSFRLAGLAHVAIALLSFTTTMSSGSSSATVGSPDDPAPAAGPASGDVRQGRTAIAVDCQQDLPALTAACLAAFAYVGIEASFTLFVSRHSQLSLGLDALRGDAAISAFWTGLLVGRVSAGLSPRSPGAGWVAGWSAAASGVIAAFGLGWIATPELAMAIAGFALGGAFPILIALAGTTLPGRAGTAVGLAAGLGSLGGFVVPWLTGKIATGAGLSTAFVVLAGWMWVLAAAAVTLRLRRARRLVA